MSQSTTDREVAGPADADRRADVRLAGRGPLDVVELDAHARPIKPLSQASVIDVAAGGMALHSATAVRVGSTLRSDVQTSTGQAQSIVLHTLACEPYAGGGFRVACRLESGRVPASLIWGWSR